MFRLTALTLCALFVACGPPAGGGGGGGGGGGTADAGSAPDAGGGGGVPTICDLHANNTFAACAGCHGVSGGVTIDLSSPQALHDSLVNSTGNSGNAMVVSGDADASWLWTRMNEMAGEDPMPPGGVLDTNVRNAVRDWINGGALNDCL